MGDIADGIINGDFDSETGGYLGAGGGFPRTKSKTRKKQKFTHPQWGKNTETVWNYLRQQGITFDTKMSEITKEYGRHIKLESTKTSDITEAIRTTTDSWREFKNWFKQRTTK